MRLNVKNLIIWLLIIAVVVAFHAVRRNSTMRGVEVSVKGNDICLLSEHDVDSLITAAYPALRQTDIKRVEKRKIQETLLQHPYVADAEVGISAGGKLQVDVTQRVPVVRMFFQNSEFYVSEQGTVMPLCAKHYCDVLVGSSECDEWLSVWRLARFIHDNPQYDGVFDQITLTAKGDLILVPKLGNTMVVVGDTNMLAEKFENLWAFYDKGVKKMGWDTYKTINLKYRDQVVGVKR